MENTWTLERKKEKGVRGEREGGEDRERGWTIREE